MLGAVMIELIIMICIGLLLVRWLRPKPGELAACWPPASTTTIHVHGPVLVVHRERGEGELNSAPSASTNKQNNQRVSCL